MWARCCHQQVLYEVYSTLRDSHWEKDVLEGRVLSRFHFFFKIFLNDSIAFPTYSLWLSKHLMSQLFIWRLNRNIIIIIIVIILLVTSALV